MAFLWTLWTLAWTEEKISLEDLKKTTRKWKGITPFRKIQTDTRAFGSGPLRAPIYSYPPRDLI